MIEEQKQTQKQVIIIAGATASGKSALGVTLAKRIGGEIVNADSMQLYRDLPTLTAAPSQDDLSVVPHHGYGVMDGGVRCSVGHWLKVTQGYVSDCRRRGKIPVLVGGTGMYIRAAMEGISPIPDIDAAYRKQATTMLAALGGGAFRRELGEYDPVLAARLDDGDSQRLIRGMEVWLATGIPLSRWQDQPQTGGITANFTTIRIAPPRDQLYARCDRRLGLMIEDGVLVEAGRLMERRLDPSLPLMKSVGLVPIFEYLKGKTSLDTAIAKARQDTRRYAKRQTTWFNNQFVDNFREDSDYNKQYSESFLSKILSNLIF